MLLHLTNTLFTIYSGLNHVKHMLLISVFGYSYTCRHTPSCTNYARAAIARDGTITGLLKGAWRVLTCW